MLIQRHSKCSSRRADCGPVAAFTLIELLVVVAIIAILMSILLPSLRAARESARAAACGARLRDFGTAMHSYFADNSDWIPGCNTSGLATRRWNGTTATALNVPDMPVQSYDWMTPLISRTTTMQESRAKRLKELMNLFRCPSQATYRAILYAGGVTASPDRIDLQNETNDWSAVSYLMPAHFQFFGTSLSNVVLTSPASGSTAGIKAQTASTSWEAYHTTYKPVLSQVGNPSQKIAAADGTRYLDETGIVDFDPNPTPGYFGSFTSSGAWWCGSTEYGVKGGSRNWNNRPVNASGDPPAQGKNLELSYRHGSTRGAGLSGACTDNRGQINALLFDGSVQRYGDKRSRNPVFWYPKGTIIKLPAEGMIDDFKANDLVP